MPIISLKWTPTKLVQRIMSKKGLTSEVATSNTSIKLIMSQGRPSHEHKWNTAWSEGTAHFNGIALLQNLAMLFSFTRLTVQS